MLCKVMHGFNPSLEVMALLCTVLAPSLEVMIGVRVHDGHHCAHTGSMVLLCTVLTQVERS